MMILVDDPMLALIMRFVINHDHLDVSDQELIQRQIRAVRNYVAQFPKEQKNEKALEWIEDNARKYRQEWQRKVVYREASETRCFDCPLIGNDASPPCEIHEQWVELLQGYIDGKIPSREYVEQTLALLKQHKTDLKVFSFSQRKGRRSKSKVHADSGC